jgi:hypothetical protein
MTVGGQDLLLTASVTAFELPGGKKVAVEGWSNHGGTMLVKSDERDVVFFTGGGEHGGWEHKGYPPCTTPPPAAVKFSREGEKLVAKVLWSGIDGKGAGSHAGLVYLNGKLYHPGGVILAADTGKVLWQDELKLMALPERGEVGQPAGPVPEAALAAKRQLLFERGLARFTALRNVFTGQTNALFDRIGLESLRGNATRTRKAIEASPFTRGLRQAMGEFFTLVRPPALNVLDGSVIGRNMQRHRHQEFIRFLNALEAELPPDKAVHVILDNYATHKQEKVRAWLARHPRCLRARLLARPHGGRRVRPAA